MGGTNDIENIIEVTVEEHAELHLSLYLKYGRWQDLRAAYGLAGLSDWKCIDGYGFRGRKHLGETKHKISQKLKNRSLSEEHKKKIGLAGKGRAVSCATRSKISHTLIGHKHTEETKLKMSESHRSREVKSNFSENARQKCYDKTSKKVKYNNVIYNSIREAARIEKVGRTEILKNGDFDI